MLATMSCADYNRKFLAWDVHVFPTFPVKEIGFLINPKISVV